MSYDGNAGNNGNENDDDSDLGTAMDNDVKSTRKRNHASQKQSTIKFSGSGYTLKDCPMAPASEKQEYKHDHDDKSTHNILASPLKKQDASTNHDTKSNMSNSVKHSKSDREQHNDNVNGNSSNNNRNSSNNGSNQNGNGLLTPTNASNLGRDNNGRNNNNSNNTDNANTMANAPFEDSAFNMDYAFEFCKQFINSMNGGNRNGNGNMNSNTNNNSEQLPLFMSGANHNSRKNSENKSNSRGLSNTSNLMTGERNNDGNGGSSVSNAHGYIDCDTGSIKKTLFPTFGDSGTSDRGMSGTNNSSNSNNSNNDSNNNNNTNNGNNDNSNVFGGSGVAEVGNGNTNVNNNSCGFDYFLNNFGINLSHQNENSSNGNSNSLNIKNLGSIAGGIDIGGGAFGTRAVSGGAGGKKNGMPYGASFLPRGTALTPSHGRVQGTPLNNNRKKNIKTWQELTKEQENDKQETAEQQDYYQGDGGECNSSMRGNNDDNYNNNDNDNENEKRRDVGSLDLQRMSGRFQDVRNRRVERLSGMLAGNETATVTINNQANVTNDRNELRKKSNEMNKTAEIDTSEGNMKYDSGINMNMNMNMNINENEKIANDLENDKNDSSNDKSDNTNENTNKNTSDTEMEMEMELELELGMTSNVIPFRDVSRRSHHHRQHHRHHEQEKQKHDETPRKIIYGKRRNKEGRPHHAISVEREGLRVPPGTRKRKFYSSQKAPTSHKHRILPTQSLSQPRPPRSQSQ